MSVIILVTWNAFAEYMDSLTNVELIFDWKVKLLLPALNVTCLQGNTLHVLGIALITNSIIR